LAAIILVDSESVDVPAPTVPAGDNRADDLSVGLGYQQSGWTTT